MMGEQYQWFVQTGRIGIWLDGAQVCLEVDSEGSEACVLTRQDAEEVARILTELSRKLWLASPDRTEPFVPQVKTLTPYSYQWVLSSLHFRQRSVSCHNAA
jgi:hypothetical protein